MYSNAGGGGGYYSGVVLQCGGRGLLQRCITAMRRAYNSNVLQQCGGYYSDVLEQYEGYITAVYYRNAEGVL